MAFEVIAVIIDRLLNGGYKSIFLIMLLCASPVLVKAEFEVKLEGTCEQFSSIVAKKEDLTAEKAVVLFMYIGLSNGQVTAYQHALLAAGYKKTLVPPAFKKPKSYFWGKMIAACKPVDVEPSEFSLLLMKNIFAAAGEQYKGERVKFNFKTMFGFSEKQALFDSEYTTVGVGNKSCSRFSEKVKEKTFFNNFYRSWVSGYLIPFAIMDELDQDQFQLMIDGVYKQATEYCEGQPDKLFAEAVFETLSKRFKK